MQSLSSGSLRLGQLWGIPIFVHWSWFVVAFIEIQTRMNSYESRLWNVLEYLSLFGIVLIHEFGHSLACRQVGGRADKIVLWPLGGVAMVQPPPRPGATLWSIAAGPLVNVVLVPLTVGLLVVSHLLHWPEEAPDLAHFVTAIAAINAGLLIFNMLPVYPLDGGQILHALLWYVLGRGRSLMIVTVIGAVAASGLLVFGLLGGGGLWLSIIAGFVLLQCFSSFGQARLLARPGVEELLTAQDHARKGELDAAIESYTRALAAIPVEDEGLRAGILNDRGATYSRKQAFDLALADYGEALRIIPANPAFLSNRGLAFWRKGDFARAVADYETALQFDPNHGGSHNNLAWLLATCPQAEFRDGQSALSHALRACELSGGNNSSFLGTLAAAFAENGRFTEAVEWQQKAMLDPDYCDLGTDKLQRRLKGYEEGHPYREELAAPSGTAWA